jgi:branched-chain amino acid transport system substrate-binding protein
MLRCLWATPTIVGVTLLLAIGCRSRPERNVVIGYAFPGTGSGVIEMVRAELARNPVPGVTIEVVYDSTVPGDSPEIEVRRAERFAAIPGLVAVVGHGGSRGTLAAAPVYNARGIPQVVPTSTSRLLQGAGPWTFLLAPNDSVEGALLARFAIQGLGVRRITIFYLNDEYGVGLRDGALLELSQLGGTLVDQVPLGIDNDLETLVEASLSRGIPDVVLVAGQQKLTGAIARFAAARVPGMRVLAGDAALVMPELAAGAGSAADSVYVAAFWAADSTNSRDQEYRERFREATGMAPMAGATMTYDAFMVLIQAIREVGPEPRAIRNWLTRLGDGRPPFDGITGAITFRQEVRPRLRIVRLHDGALVPVHFP